MAPAARGSVPICSVRCCNTCKRDGRMTTIAGPKVTLKRARITDRARIYEWLIGSDLTAHMMGGAMFPDRPIPSMDEFIAHYPDTHFDGSRPYAGRMLIINVNGEDIGCVSHGAIDLRNDVVELDIWLAERRLAGHGFGSEALVVLCDWLQANYGVNRFLVRPSRRNVKALRAMRRAGFRETDLPAQEIEAKLALPTGAYADEVLLFRILNVPSPVLRPDPTQTYVFIDSEFTDLTAPQLISVGAVATDSTAFYAELQGWNPERASAFVQDSGDAAARRRCRAGRTRRGGPDGVARATVAPHADDDHQRLRLRPLGTRRVVRARGSSAQCALAAGADYVRGARRSGAAPASCGAIMRSTMRARCDTWSSKPSRPDQRQSSTAAPLTRPGSDSGQRRVGLRQRKHLDGCADGHLRGQRQELLAIGARQVGHRADAALAPQPAVREGRDVAHVDAGADDGAALARGLQRGRHQRADRREDQRRIQRLGCVHRRIAGPAAAQRAGEGLARQHRRAS